MLAAMGVQPASDKPTLQCEIGPVKKSFGGNPWLVYSCSDGTTLVVVSAAQSPANPFYFVFYPKDGSYGLSGEGTGAKQATDAAFEDLKKLPTNDISALIRETKDAPPSTSAIPRQ
jgi:hypothetical protein